MARKTVDWKNPEHRALFEAAYKLGAGTAANSNWFGMNEALELGEFAFRFRRVIARLLYPSLIPIAYPHL